MSTLDWIVIIVIIIPVLTLMIGVALLLLPDGIIFMKDLAEAIVEEWRNFPGRLK